MIEDYFFHEVMRKYLIKNNFWQKNLIKVDNWNLISNFVIQ